MFDVLWILFITAITVALVAEIRSEYSKETVVHVCDNTVLTDKGNMLYVTERLRVGDRIVVENKHTFVGKLKGETE